MANLRVPSLQHLSRSWRRDSPAVARLLVRLALNPPIFSYSALYAAVRDLLLLQVPYDQVLAGIKRIPRRDVRENFLEVLPLIRDHFEGISPDFFQYVDRRYYPVGRDLMVPFDPPMIFGMGGKIYFPWLSFWRRNPLAGEALSLFVSLVDDILMQDPDLESATFQIIDFSCTTADGPRQLRVIDAGEIARLSETRKKEMLETFALGFSAAREELAKRTKAEKQEKPETHPDQLALIFE